MPRFHTIDDLDVAGKRVLLRADLNVPAKDGQVTDATRIERLTPTIEAPAASNLPARSRNACVSTVQPGVSAFG